MPPVTVSCRLTFASPNRPASPPAETEFDAIQPNSQPCMSVCVTFQLTLLVIVREPPVMSETDLSQFSSQLTPSVRVRVSVVVCVYETVEPLLSPPERQPESGLACSI